MALLSRLNIDPYIVAIVGMVGLASLAPVHGDGAVIAGHATQVAIAVLFFLHGAKLEPRAALAGARQWRLHLAVLLSTFVLFPVLGLTAHAMMPHLLPPSLWAGLLLLCFLPSTVQASIAFTSIARGNVPAAICAATASNLLGIILTPLLAGLLLHAHGGFSVRTAVEIAMQLLLPFLAGQLSRPWIGAWIAGNRSFLGLVDRGSILLLVYVAFSNGVTHGIWHQVDATVLVSLLAVNAGLLASVLVLTTVASRLMGLATPDEIVVVLCGSKKSLASGLSMAAVLFAGQPSGLIVLPMMLFHQIQLMACAALARRYAERSEARGGPRAVSDLAVPVR